MSQPHLDYATPAVTRRSDPVRPGRMAIAVVAAVWVVANACVVLIAAATPDGFQAMGIAVFGAAAANAVVLLVSVGPSPCVVRIAGRTALVPSLPVAVLFPAAAYLGDFSAAGFLRRLSGANREGASGDAA